MNWVIEWTKWLVAPVSMIQVLDLYACLSTTWAEKMEWEWLGGIQYGLLEKLDEQEGEMEVVVEICGMEEFGVMIEATWWAAWVPFPNTSAT